MAQPFHRAPGEVPKVFNTFNLLTLPDPTENIAQEGTIKGKLNPMDFFTDDPTDDLASIPFSHYRYYGSETQPPCAEHVLWIVAAEARPISSTILGMFSDALKTDDDLVENNRQLMPINKREVLYWQAADKHPET